MKTQKEFIIETLLPYKQDLSNCAYDVLTAKCSYLSTDNKKCAIGKWMKEGEWQYFEGDVKELFIEYEMEEIMEQEFLQQDMSLELMILMQRYHDNLAMGRYIDIIVSSMEKEIGEDLTELKL